MPTTDADLETSYTAQEVTDVGSSNDVWVDQTATAEYMIHEYKEYAGAETELLIIWEGKSSLAPSSSTIYLQVYNYDTDTWDAGDSNNTAAADTDFRLQASISDLTNYKNESSIVTARVYQLDQ